MDGIQTLFEQDGRRTEPVLLPEMRQLYDGDLSFPAASKQRPYAIANFVSTLDGVASFRLEGHSSGSSISGSDPGDRFIMGLLRASVDAVLIGANTIHEVEPESLWIPEYTYPEARTLYRDYRVNVLHKREYPLIVVISGSGRLELGRKVFRTPQVTTLIVTTVAGRKQLEAAGVASLASVELRTLEDLRGSVDTTAILELLSSQFGVQMLLHEGAPTLFGEFLGAQLVDELFLTVAPQIAGRTAHTLRPGLAEAVEFMPKTAPWFQLLSVKQRADHLYLRYRLTGSHPQAM